MTHQSVLLVEVYSLFGHNNLKEYVHLTPGYHPPIEILYGTPSCRSGVSSNDLRLIGSSFDTNFKYPFTYMYICILPAL